MQIIPENGKLLFNNCLSKIYNLIHYILSKNLFNLLTLNLSNYEKCFTADS
jgi:hypothetical protein